MSFIVFGAPDGPGKAAELAVRARLLWHKTTRSFGLYLGLGIGLIASLFIAIALIPTPPATPPAPEPLPQSPWAAIERPAGMYGLNAPDYGRDPTTFTAKRHREGRGRIDVMTWGRLDDDAHPYLRLAVHRVGREPTEDSSFFIHMVREAAGFGAAVTRGNVADPLPTRFGLFEAADVMLDANGAKTSSAKANCMGFRFASPERLVRMTGFACGTSAHPIDRQTLACTIERIELVSAGDDHDLARFFASAATHRDPACLPRRASQTSEPINTPMNILPNAQSSRQANWIDQTGTAAPLRGVAAKPRRR
ncbi:hypothetical protein [Methylocella sp. CPCC 101449]|jgi:hypothetical protein|uniref:hypothetical protein n=1 Tax=Methylocella sp. CPCC 101449 TaxID=2987531 RepID=UPI0028922E37|nr:hypothetical protein [Methylocella sp. CPCC 101449]MDT2020698.1 hypothetical protein [Methylocella sp. CPCC 101449]HEV2574363.1 hypothetical protein [Beijerinckiaceae bacterium]